MNLKEWRKIVKIIINIAKRLILSYILQLKMKIIWSKIDLMISVYSWMNFELYKWKFSFFLFFSFLSFSINQYWFSFLLYLFNIFNNYWMIIIWFLIKWISYIWFWINWLNKNIKEYRKSIVFNNWYII